MKPKVFWPRKPETFYSASKPLADAAASSPAHNASLHASPAQKRAPLADLPTKTLLRSLFLTSAMASPLLKPSIAVLKYVVDSKSPLLSPSKNPIMNYILRATIYNHFCAGVNETEVRKTVQDMKTLGFKGVILGYARESVAKIDGAASHVEEWKNDQAIEDRAVDEWKEGNLRTLRMVGKGDYMNIKFTGAGPAAVEALARGDLVPPPRIKQAITEICEATAAQGSRFWIDAEQQIFQPAIDAWTIDLMRQFNRDGRVVVLNTVQAYLKSSAENIHRHLTLAGKEGWALGIKLVRGAYIQHDIRDRIHDTKADTDRNYNHIVESLLSRQSPFQELQDTKFPDARLFVATHNAESVRRAYSTSRHRILNGLPTIPLEMGQLQGMADEVSCGLLAEYRPESDASSSGKSPVEASVFPKVFKCLAWGTTEECLHFLLRRAVENQGAVVRTQDTAAAMRKEAWRRIGLRW
ncbi:FAD-linked oxidoreductase-like protein [Aspergillus pseudonomiae]|uniref:Proline dehydrogenase n=1 Tax=Aspergillus pseudonomiae TaxID=1506151 RepID=A0A5N6HUW4_9EURO|nr:FAD-linked oxidoreductase-like protein [Aspergillus pseudonomiae]KAB8257624.1 FAD-linked oxidoreductase-like protein [Aspergillus pseudonomiae]KAE8402910.1 FAD-linked oxidoreductase-like protein [Aspergillus pseudonomiae]